MPPLEAIDWAQITNLPACTPSLSPTIEHDKPTKSVRGMHMTDIAAMRILSTQLNEDTIWEEWFRQQISMHLWCKPMLSRYSRDPLPSQMPTPFCFSTLASVLPLMNHSNSSATPAHGQLSCFNMTVDKAQTVLP